jgi:hypothetical protein
MSATEHLLHEQTMSALQDTAVPVTGSYFMPALTPPAVYVVNNVFKVEHGADGYKSSAKRQTIRSKVM